MSIFKDTLKEQVYQQIKTREKIVAGETTNNLRSPLLPWYLSKNSWVRMTSFVNYDEGEVIPDGKGGVKVDTTKGNYKNKDLSEKYILQGGTLYTKKNGKTLSVLRKGIAEDGAAYGGNIDYSGNNQDPNYFRKFGIRPMPGITSVDMRTVNAYGSVYEATVKFYAWDTHQLNELEILFMRPGYSVLLEWGWSQYVSNNLENKIFPGATIDTFENGLTQQKVYNMLQDLREEYDYNYDGMLGFVKNFNWTLLPDGGFECTTTLISWGEVMSTLRIAATSNNFTKNGSSPTINPQQSKPYYDDYETILLSLKFAAENYYSPGYSKATGQDIYLINEDQYRGNFVKDDAIPISEIASKLESNGWNSEAKRLLNDEPLVKFVTQGESNPSGLRFEYISLPVWIAIMDSYFSYNINPKNQKDKLVKFYPVGANDICLAGKDSISSDIRVCVVNNPEAFPEFTNISPDGYDQPGINPMLNQNQTSNQAIVSIPSFYDKTRKVGIPANIYINTELLLNEYKNLNNNSKGEGVELLVYVQNILNRISQALGGLNNFKITSASRDQNNVRIADFYYLENEPTKKKMLNLFGQNTIFTNVKIESQIFPEQSNIIAVAAQSRANLGDVYNSSQVYLNAGLTDRLAPQKGPGNSLENPDSDNYPLYQKLLDFLIFVRNGVVGNLSSDPGGENFDVHANAFVADPNLTDTSPSGYLKNFLLQFDGEMAFKALIPFKLEVTLEGLGGFVIGEIFKVNGNILPKNYYDKNLGFIITGIQHKLSENTWSTTLQTQICILDHHKLGSMFTNKIKREGFKKWIDEAKIDSILYPILVDFVMYQAYRSFTALVHYAYNSSRLPGSPFNDSVSYIIENYLVGNDSRVVNSWASAVENMIDKSSKIAAGSGTTVRKYDLNEFIDFTFNWLENYKKIHANDGVLDVQFTEDKKLSQILDDITKPTFDGIVVNTWTTTYRDKLQEISDYFQNVNDPATEPLSWFHQNGGKLFAPNGLYKQLNKKVEIPDRAGNVIGYRDEPDGYGLDNTTLQSRVDGTISTKFPGIYQYWNTLNTHDKTPLNTLFYSGESGLFVPLNIGPGYNYETLRAYMKTMSWDAVGALGTFKYKDISEASFKIGR